MISRYMKEKLSGGSVIRAMFEAGAEMRKERGADKVFDYSLGNPYLDPPKEMIEAGKGLIEQSGVHSYMPNAGYPDVRHSVAVDYNRRFQTKLTERDLLMTVGAAGALNVFLKTVINPGDEIVVFAPYFVEYRFYAENVGAVLRTVPTDDAFRPNPAALHEAITPKTKVLITNSPNNPTGVVYTDEELTAIANVLSNVSQTIYWISDEPYREIVYDHAPMTSILRHYRHSVIAYSYSKSASIPGERIGYLATHPEIEDATNMHQALVTANRILGFVNAPSLFQHLVGRFPSQTCAINYYKKNRDILMDILKTHGFKYIKPEGAFYLFVASPIPDESAFCQTAMAYGLLMVPSSAFGIAGWVRLAYCVDTNMIRRSAEAFRLLRQKYASEMH